MKIDNLVKIAVFIGLALLASAYISSSAYPMEFKAGMKWKPHQSGIIVWHTPQTACLHDTAGNFEAPEWYTDKFLDHGNYVAVLVESLDPPWVYWIGKEPNICSTNGVDSVPVAKKSWKCDKTCKAQ